MGSTRGPGSGFDVLDQTMEELSQSVDELGRSLERKMGREVRGAIRSASGALRTAAKSVRTAEWRGPAVPRPQREANPGGGTGPQPVWPRRHRREEADLAFAGRAGRAKRGLCFAVGVLGTAVGALLLLIALCMFIVGLAQADAEILNAALAIGIVGLPFGGAGLAGFLTARRMRRFWAYQDVLDDSPQCPVAQLAMAVCRSERYVQKDLEKMIRKGYFKRAYLDPQGAYLFTDGAAYRAWAQRRAEEPAAQPAPHEPVPAGGTLDECRLFLKTLEAEKGRIDDALVLEQVETLEKQARQIVVWLEQHPGAEQSVKRFAGYYMPTTLKLLRTYNEVDPQADDSAVASGIQTDICGILYTVNKAFRSLQDGLLQDTALDVSAEIAALEAVLAQDGLTQQDFQTAP